MSSGSSSFLSVQLLDAFSNSPYRSRDDFPSLQSSNVTLNLRQVPACPVLSLRAISRFPRVAERHTPHFRFSPVTNCMRVFKQLPRTKLSSNIQEYLIARSSEKLKNKVCNRIGWIPERPTARVTFRVFPHHPLSLSRYPYGRLGRHCGESVSLPTSSW